MTTFPSDRDPEPVAVLRRYRFRLLPPRESKARARTVTIRAANIDDARRAVRVPGGWRVTCQPGLFGEER